MIVFFVPYKVNHFVWACVNFFSFFVPSGWCRCFQYRSTNIGINIAVDIDIDIGCYIGLPISIAVFVVDMGVSRYTDIDGVILFNMEVCRLGIFISRYRCECVS